MYYTILFWELVLKIGRLQKFEKKREHSKYLLFLLQTRRRLSTCTATFMNDHRSRKYTVGYHGETHIHTRTRIVPHDTMGADVSRQVPAEDETTSSSRSKCARTKRAAETGDEGRSSTNDKKRVRYLMSASSLHHIRTMKSSYRASSTAFEFTFDRLMHECECL